MNGKKIAVDSTVLLQGAEGVADSRILSGFRSMIESEAVARARAAGYEINEKYCHTGEFGLDIIGETGAGSPMLPNGSLLPEGAKRVLWGEFSALISLDVNGFPRRAAASAGLINMKPSFGASSRYGVVQVVSSADTVSITASTVEQCAELLAVICGQDCKDPTTANSKNSPINTEQLHGSTLRIGIPRKAIKEVDPAVMRCFVDLISRFDSIGAKLVNLPQDADGIFTVAHAAWNTVLCAEAWGNLSRYDGVRYGNRASNYEDLNETYVNTRSKGFGELVKSALLYGSYALSPDREDGGFFKAAQAREWVMEQVNRLFSETDVILLPATSVPFYTDEIIKTRGITAFSENFYTALPSLCGLPTVTVNGVQLIGKPFSDGELLNIAMRINA